MESMIIPWLEVEDLHSACNGQMERGGSTMYVLSVGGSSAHVGA